MNLIKQIKERTSDLYQRLILLKNKCSTSIVIANVKTDSLKASHIAGGGSAKENVQVIRKCRLLSLNH